MVSFSPILPAHSCFAGLKIYMKKTEVAVTTLKREEAGEVFLLRVSRDFWLRLHAVGQDMLNLLLIFQL